MVEEDNIDGLIMSCDDLKCFNRIEFQSIFRAMQFLRFADLLIDWVRTMYMEF